MDNLKTLLWHLHDDGLAVVTVNRPDKLNALNKQVLAELDLVVSEAKLNGDVKGLILTGSGDKSFVAGADISEFRGLDAQQAEAIAVLGQRIFSDLESLPIPVIAAVNGFALGGGCELAMACHLRLASENARFGQPEVNLGLIPGYGGTQRLSRLVGQGRALELILSAKMISAQRAYEIGLANAVTTSEDLLEEAASWMRKIMSKAPVAVANSIKAVAASDLPLAQGLATEAALFGETFETDDFKEGVDAFLEKRTPNFKGS